MAAVWTTLIGISMLGYVWFDNYLKTHPLETLTQHCINGVSYLKFSSAATVEYTPEGKIKRCEHPTFTSEGPFK